MQKNELASELSLLLVLQLVGDSAAESENQPRTQFIRLYNAVREQFHGDSDAEETLERVWPDATVILDVDTETAGKRMNRELDRMELKGQAYHQKVRQGFLDLAQSQDRFVVVDATQAIEAVHEAVIQGVTGSL